MHSKSGLFITFEGGDGCGKSTQSRILYQKLLQLNIPCILIQEPGGTPLGIEVGNLLKTNRQIEIEPLAELFLFAACRAQIVSEIIKPALDAAKIVLCDRFADSTIVYQGFARGIDLNLVNLINDAATCGLKPDLTILLDIPPQPGLRRKGNSHSDRFETEDIAFHQRVREGYLELARREPGRWLVINGEQTGEMISQIIWEKVRHLLP